MNLIHDAIVFASKKHKEQLRKGTDIPYISHPMEVMQILTAENICSEKVIIAGILHDVLEDTKTKPQEIAKLFGDDVLKIVKAETEDKTKSWKERKQTTIDNLADATSEVKIVCLADKLANLRSMAADIETKGEKLWKRFNASKDDIEWYYRQVYEAVSLLSQTAMYKEYKSLLEQVFS